MANAANRLAHSPDLVHWFEQRSIPLMTDVAGTDNVWAPEICWDKAKSEWLIIRSRKVPARAEGNRIYMAVTRDFRQVSAPQLFFDPGYDVIDATILQANGRYYLVFIDERKDSLRNR